MAHQFNNRAQSTTVYIIALSGLRVPTLHKCFTLSLKKLFSLHLGTMLYKVGTPSLF